MSKTYTTESPEVAFENGDIISCNFHSNGMVTFEHRRVGKVLYSYIYMKTKWQQFKYRLAQFFIRLDRELWRM